MDKKEKKTDKKMENQNDLHNSTVENADINNETTNVQNNVNGGQHISKEDFMNNGGLNKQNSSNENMSLSNDENNFDYATLLDRLDKKEIEMTPEIKLLLERILLVKNKHIELNNKEGEQKNYEKIKENDKIDSKINNEESDAMVDENNLSQVSLTQNDKRNNAIDSFMLSTNQKMDQLMKLLTDKNKEQHSEKNIPSSIDKYVTYSSKKRKEKDKNKLLIENEMLTRQINELKNRMEFFEKNNNKKKIEFSETHNYKNNKKINKNNKQPINTMFNKNGKREFQTKEDFDSEELKRLRLLISENNPSSLYKNTVFSEQKILSSNSHPETKTTMTDNRIDLNSIPNSKKLELILQEDPFFKLANLNNKQGTGPNGYYVKSSKQYSNNNINNYQNVKEDFEKMSLYNRQNSVAMSLAFLMKEIPFQTNIIPNSI